MMVDPPPAGQSSWMADSMRQMSHLGQRADPNPVEADSPSAPQTPPPVADAIKSEASVALRYARYLADRAALRLKGHDNMTDEEIEKAAKHREAMAELAARQKARAVSPAPPVDTRSWSTYVKDAIRGVQAAFSTSSGMAAIVDHCAKAHAAEVAIQQNIDVKNVSVVTEKATVGEGTKVVGYIEAPAATDEEVYAYAAKLQQACPAARTHGGVEWRRGSPGEGRR